MLARGYIGKSKILRKLAKIFWGHASSHNGLNLAISTLFSSKHGCDLGPYFFVKIISFVSVAATFLCQLVAKFCQKRKKTHLEFFLQNLLGGNKWKP